MVSTVCGRLYEEPYALIGHVRVCRGVLPSVSRIYFKEVESYHEFRSSNASGPAHQREEFRIGFFACYNRLWELIDSRNDLQHYQDGFQVLGTPTIIERVAREALLNAASHRSYRMSSSIFVRQYRDRLVIDSPGGLPSGVTIDNILDKQSARNPLVASIFALCGLVERAGQGMNLIYEMCIKEAKALPDFKGTDPYFVCITLNGLIIDEKLLLIFKRIDSNIIDTFTTEDYLAINSLYRSKKFPANLRPQVKRLADLGIVEHIGYGKYLIARQLYEAVGETSAHTWFVDMDRMAIKGLLLKHIEQKGDEGVPPRDLQKVLPSHSRRQIQILLSELKNEGRVYSKGQTTSVRWFHTSEQ